MTDQKTQPFLVPPRASAPIIDSTQTVPINRIFCVGRNYAAHAREMGANPDREPPFFFTKPADAIHAGAHCKLPYPPRTSDLHHEVELVLVVGKGGRDIPVDTALTHIYAVALGIDFTRRDLQADAKKGGKPWDMAKGFDGSAILGPVLPLSGKDIPQHGTIELSVDGQVRQSGDLADMIWSLPEVIAELSSYLTLQPGDLIYTGTPEGVGAVEAGQIMQANLSAANACAIPSLTVEIIDPL